jgi:hypothetical protein
MTPPLAAVVASERNALMDSVGDPQPIMGDQPSAAKAKGGKGIHIDRGLDHNRTILNWNRPGGAVVIAPFMVTNASPRDVAVSLTDALTREARQPSKGLARARAAVKVCSELLCVAAADERSLILHHSNAQTAREETAAAREDAVMTPTTHEVLDAAQAARHCAALVEFWSRTSGALGLPDGVCVSRAEGLLFTPPQARPAGGILIAASVHLRRFVLPLLVPPAPEPNLTHPAGAPPHPNTPGAAAAGPSDALFSLSLPLRYRMAAAALPWSAVDRVARLLQGGGDAASTARLLEVVAVAKCDGSVAAAAGALSAAARTAWLDALMECAEAESAATAAPLGGTAAGAASPPTSSPTRPHHELRCVAAAICSTVCAELNGTFATSNNRCGDSSIGTGSK